MPGNLGVFRTLDKVSRIGPQPGWFLTRKLARDATRYALAALALTFAGVVIAMRVSLPVGIILALAGYLLVALRWQDWGRLARGRRAEILVGRCLESLDGKVAHSVPLGGVDADHVHVGRAVASVETKSAGGKVSVSRGIIASNGTPLRADPIAQSARISKKVAARLGVRVHPVVCLAHARQVHLFSSGVLIVSPDTLASALQSLPAQPAAEKMRAVQVLAQLMSDARRSPAGPSEPG